METWVLYCVFLAVYVIGWRLKEYNIILFGTCSRPRCTEQHACALILIHGKRICTIFVSCRHG